MPIQKLRRQLMQEALHQQGFPPDNIYFWSHQEQCSTNYEKCSDLLKAAASDGFPVFEKWLNNRRELNVPIGIFSQLWNTFKMWKQVIDDSTPYFMCLYDDAPPNKPYSHYTELVQIADEDSQGKWKVISLMADKESYAWNKEGGMEGVDPKILERWPPIVDEKGLLVRGLPGLIGDTAYIISKAGVDWLLKLYDDNYNYLEDKFGFNREEPYTYSSNGKLISTHITYATSSTIHNEAWREKAG